MSFARWGRRRPAGRNGVAVFLNDTSSSYHWGCYGTSMTIYGALVDAGYSVIPFDVETTHFGMGAPPTEPTDEAFRRFGDNIGAVNPMLRRALEAADLVVVNGEGTLHRFHPGPRSLLSAIRLARDLGKRVQLINHACFPSGTAVPADPAIERFYAAALSGLDRIVVRDDWSGLAYARLGLAFHQGFDCLPLYVERFLERKGMPKSIVFGASTIWDAATVTRTAEAIRPHLPAQSPMVFLSGGHRREPPEDQAHFEQMRAVLPGLQIVRPASLAEWIGWIRSAELLVTGRFHHYVAAAAVSAPVVMMPGNTAKNGAVASMLGHPAPIEPTDPDLSQRLGERMRDPSRTTTAQVRQITKLSRRNLVFS